MTGLSPYRGFVTTWTKTLDGELMGFASCSGIPFLIRNTWLSLAEQNSDSRPAQDLS